MNPAASVTEIELGNLFVEQARAISVLEQIRKLPEPAKKSDLWDGLIIVGFKENVVGRVAPEHLKHREECSYNPRCAWCHQAGRGSMELRNYKELDAIAEAKLMRLVKKGHPEATVFYLHRRERDESLWTRIKYLLGI